MLGTFEEDVNDACFLMSIPMKNGKLIEVDEDCKLVFKIANSAQEKMFSGYVDAVVKKGIRNFWQVRRVADPKLTIQRISERIDCTLKVKYWQPTWAVNFDGDIEAEEALTLNISAEGLAMYLADVFHVGEFCEIELPKLGRSKAGQSISLVGEVCWNREPSKGAAYKNICGIKFNHSDDSIKKKMQDYVNNLKKYKS